MADRPQTRWPEREVLYLALTRPSLKWGVPLEGFALNVLVTFFAGAEFSSGRGWWRCPLFIWLLGVPAHFLMRELTALDYNWCRTIRLRLISERRGEWLEAIEHPVRHWRNTYSSV